MHTDFATLTAGTLLAIPEDQPERLFKGSPDDIKKASRLLAMRWHPDRNPDPDALAVFQHIRRIVDKAEEKIARGAWPGRGVARFTATDGAVYEINHLRRHRSELGTMYVAGTAVAFEIDRAHADLVRNAEHAVGGFTYASERMREQIAPQLPAFPFVAAFRTETSYVIVMRKSPDMLLLRDVLDHFDSSLDPRHVAWIVSALLNLCCYFEYTGITHNALSPDTCFISPQAHSVALLGGWWYATRSGGRMVAAPAGTVAWGPHDLLTTKRAAIRTDLELVRALGRELLGDIGGTRLARDSAAPQAMIDWLRLPASDNPIEEYRIWRTQVLHDSFGVRRFVELPLTQSDLYR